MEKKENQIVKGAKGLLPYVLTPAMLVYIIWASSEFKTESKQLQFQTVEQRVKTKDHINSEATDIEMYKALQTFDSVLQFQKEYNEDTKKSRAKKDSLNLLDKTTMYQMKQAIEEINEKINN